MFDLAGKRAVVPGAARGIGKEIARKYCELGAKVMAADVDEAWLAASVEEIRSEGGAVWPVRLDLADNASIAAAMKESAAAACSLASDEAAFTTGAILDVNGGAYFG